jgi:hypothetical protein
VEFQILKLVVCILLRVLGQVQGLLASVALDGNPEPDLEFQMLLIYKYMYIKLMYYWFHWYEKCLIKLRDFSIAKAFILNVFNMQNRSIKGDGRNI